MRIATPELIASPDAVVLQARVALGKSAGGSYPERLWFKFPSRFAPLIGRGIEPFVVALSSLACARNEGIDIDMPISERLAVGLEEYWTIMSGWAPHRFGPIVLNTNGFAPPLSPPPHAATAFSGGVDSFHTLYRGLAYGLPRPPAHRIRYALFIHGFDVPRSDRRTYDTVAAAYEQELAKDDVELVRVETNARDFIPDWDFGHGTSLGGTAMTLANGVRRFFVPSSKSYGTLEPWGSDPLIDHLMSTDSFQIVHDGARATRFDKLADIQHSRSIRGLLRTCYERLDGLHNCGKCQNCRRTMLVLASLGILDEFATFPRVGSPLYFIGTRWETPHERLFARQSIAHASQHGRHELAWVTRIAMLTSRLKQLVTYLKVRSRPARYRLKAAFNQFRGAPSVTKKQQA